MSKKLKFKKEKGLYRFHLTHDELVLIAKFMTHVRLGDGRYAEAAGGILEGIANLDEGIYDEASSNIVFQVGIETADGDDYSAVIKGEESVIEVWENIIEVWENI